MPENSPKVIENNNSAKGFALFASNSKSDQWSISIEVRNKSVKYTEQKIQKWIPNICQKLVFDRVNF